jgi:hypothetical protein
MILAQICLKPSFKMFTWIDSMIAIVSMFALPRLKLAGRSPIGLSCNPGSKIYRHTSSLDSAERLVTPCHVVRL